jgi:hypothetical protein
MVFGQLYATAPNKFGSIFQNFGQKIGDLYSKAQQIPQVNEALQKYNIPGIISAGQGVISGIKNLFDVGKNSADMVKRNFQR